MFELLPESDDTVVGVKMTGTLTDADYQAFMPGLEQLIAGTRPPRWYIDWEDLEGWDQRGTANAFYFRIKHRYQFKRVAMVVDDALRDEAAEMLALFTNADVRLFPPSEKHAAWAWLRSA